MKKKIILVLVGVISILFGASDLVVACFDSLGAVLKTHIQYLLIIGAIALVIAWIVDFREKIGEVYNLPFMAILPFNQVLIPPENTPIQEWNPGSLTGSEVWGLIALLVMVGLVIWMARSSIKRAMFPQKGRW